MRERKIKLEVQVARDDEGRWWVIASVDDEEALQHGHTKIRQPPRKRQSSSSLSLKKLRMRKISGSSLRATCQLGTDKRRGGRPRHIEGAFTVIGLAISLGFIIAFHISSYSAALFAKLGE
jgi:hypothetical protein